MNNKTNTDKGIRAEHLFSKTILEHADVFEAICESLGIASTGMLDVPNVIGGKHRKTDVEIVFKNSSAPTIKVSVKSFKDDAGYNHLERRKFEDFCKRNQFSNADKEFLARLWLRKAADTRKQKLVEDDEQERVKKIFSKVEPAASGILGNDHPQILALYNSDKLEWRIYDIMRQILPEFRSAEIGFTLRSNIAIGDYIVIQRKGSNKGESGSNPLTNINHGANDVQIKIRAKKIFNNIEPLASYEV